MDLVTFLRARLDERERVARQAGGRRWTRDPQASHPSRELMAPFRDDFSIPIVVDAAVLRIHIRANDPQFVLADVAAKRRIVDEFGDAGEWLPANRDDDEPEYAYGRARTLHDVIKLLAASFAQHPDFDPAWSVEA